jgi:hypothetical protein
MQKQALGRSNIPFLQPSTHRKCIRLSSKLGGPGQFHSHLLTVVHQTVVKAGRSWAVSQPSTHRKCIRLSSKLGGPGQWRGGYTASARSLASRLGRLSEPASTCATNCISGSGAAVCIIITRAANYSGTANCITGSGAADYITGCGAGLCVSSECS